MYVALNRGFEIIQYLLNDAYCFKLFSSPKDIKECIKRYLLNDALLPKALYNLQKYEDNPKIVTLVNEYLLIRNIFYCNNFDYNVIQIFDDNI